MPLQPQAEALQPRFSVLEAAALRTGEWFGSEASLALDAHNRHILCVRVSSIDFLLLQAGAVDPFRVPRGHNTQLL